MSLTFCNDSLLAVGQLYHPSFKPTMHDASGYFAFGPLDAATGRPPFVTEPAPGSSDGEAISHFVLSQNEPNPCVDETSIPFSLAFAADVQLSLFDLLGRKVAGIIRKGLGPGEHRIPLNLRGLDLPAGAYTYQLRVINRYGVHRQSGLMTTSK